MPSAFGSHDTNHDWEIPDSGTEIAREIPDPSLNEEQTLRIEDEIQSLDRLS
jgi:hypothetical protein